jgi:hypothetical protein
MVPKPKDRSQIIKKMHDEIGHFGEARTILKSNNNYSSMTK